MKTTSDAMLKAIEKYDGKFDIVRFRVPLGRKAEIKAHAESLGMSLNAYVNKLVDEDMGRAETVHRD